MNDPNALVTVAMLSAFQKSEKTDYLDIISQFVFASIPQIIGASIDFYAIQSKMSSFGFSEFPIDVIKKILSRASKTPDGCIRYERGNYTLVSSIDTTEFENRQKSIKDAQEKVINALREYLVNNSRYQSCSFEFARDRLVFFLESNGLHVLKEIDELRGITSDDYDIHHVARFVLSEHEVNSSVFMDIAEVVRGYLVYKAIYYFSRKNSIAINSAIKDTTFFLDTRLLIEALGYNTDEGKTAAKELFDLISDTGGKLATFPHVISEIKHILKKYGSDVQYRSKMTLYNLERDNYDQDDVLTLCKLLESSLDKLGVTVNNIDKFDCTTSQVIRGIDPQDIWNTISEVHSNTCSSRRIENDAASIYSVMAKRGNKHYTRIERAKAVFVTTNTSIVTAANKLWQSHAEDDEIDVAFSDIDIAALLWLKSWDNRSSLPINLLLEFAYAATHPSNSLIDTFIDVLDKLEKRGTVSPEDAFLLRSDGATRDILLTTTQNDISKVTEQSVLEIRKTVLDRYTDEKNKIIAQQERELSSERRKKTRAIAVADIEAKEASKVAYQVAKILVYTLYCLIAIFGIVATILSSIPAEKTRYSMVMYVVVTIIGVVGIIDLAVGKKQRIDGLLHKFQNWVFTLIHNRKVNVIKKMFSDDTNNATN